MGGAGSTSTNDINDVTPFGEAGVVGLIARSVML